VVAHFAPIFLKGGYVLMDATNSSIDVAFSYAAAKSNMRQPTPLVVSVAEIPLMKKLGIPMTIDVR
jgi:hypothetical protein